LVNYVLIALLIHISHAARQSHPTHRRGRHRPLSFPPPPNSSLAPHLGHDARGLSTPSRYVGSIGCGRAGTWRCR
jgi:hypothetical protein